MFKIYTKRAFEFRNAKTGETIRTAFMAFFTVPDWVRDDLMFKTGLKTGSISVIQSAEQQMILENGDDPDPELTEMRARGVELKIPRASQMGKEKLAVAIAEAESKLKGNPDPLDDMDESGLRQFAESNSIDISAVPEDASADDLRAAIKAAKG